MSNGIPGRLQLFTKFSIPCKPLFSKSFKMEKCFDKLLVFSYSYGDEYFIGGS